MQRQVHSQPASMPAEANRRNPDPRIMIGSIWLDKDKIARIENGDVYSVATNLKFAIVGQDNDLRTPEGQPLFLNLEMVNGGGRIPPGSNAHAIATFMELAGL